MNRLIAVLVLASLAGTATAASTKAEIEAALVGNTFQGGMGGSGYSSYFDPTGTYRDKDGSGAYTITDEGVCYPGTDFGCYAATIEGDQLEWSKGGKSEGKGVIVEGNPLKF